MTKTAARNRIKRRGITIRKTSSHMNLLSRTCLGQFATAVVLAPAARPATDSLRGRGIILTLLSVEMVGGHDRGERRYFDPGLLRPNPAAAATSGSRMMRQHLVFRFRVEVPLRGGPVHLSPDLAAAALLVVAGRCVRSQRRGRPGAV
jgi:hypothetical protein